MVPELSCLVPSNDENLHRSLTSSSSLSSSSIPYANTTKRVHVLPNSMESSSLASLSISSSAMASESISKIHPLNNTTLPSQTASNTQAKVITSEELQLPNQYQKIPVISLPKIQPKETPLRISSSRFPTHRASASFPFPSIPTSSTFTKSSSSSSTSSSSTSSLYLSPPPSIVRSRTLSSYSETSAFPTIKLYYPKKLNSSQKSCHSSLKSPSSSSSSSTSTMNLSSLRNPYPASLKDWRATVSIEERQAVRDKIRHTYQETCKTYETLLETIIAMEEDLLLENAPSRLDYFKNGLDYEKRIQNKVKHMNGNYNIFDEVIQLQSTLPQRTETEEETSYQRKKQRNSFSFSPFQQPPLLSPPHLSSSSSSFSSIASVALSPCQKVQMQIQDTIPVPSHGSHSQPLSDRSSSTSPSSLSNSNLSKKKRYHAYP